jgi:uncharacterized caspase-like protein
VRDAQNIAATLELSSRGVYDRVNTQLLLNSTRAEILNAFDKAARVAKPQDTIVFYYSGQGFSEDISELARGGSYLIPSDFNAEVGVASAISTSVLRSLFTKLQARRRLIIWDAAHSATGFESLAKSISEENQSFTDLLQRDIAFVTLSGGLQIDLARGEGKGHSLLTYALLKGLKGPADTNGDGVSGKELIDYARSYVKGRVPSIPNLSRSQKRVEVKSYFAGQDFPLSWTSKSRNAHGRNPPLNQAVAVSLAPRAATQQEPQKRPTEVMGRTDSAVSRAPRARTGKDYALLIATNTYDEWSGLTNPVPDAEAIEDELKNYYGFETELITNPTKAGIIAALKKYKNQTKFADDDQLFIFFAGHGTFVDDFREGYLISKNSLKNDPDASTYLSHSQLRNVIDQIPCRHIFLVIDACFGGTFDEKIARRGDGEKDYAEATNLEFIDRKMRFQTRQFLTSGGKEYVPDGRPGQHSPFARRFLEALRSYGGNDGILTIARILSYIERVTPEPRRGEWGGNEPGSDFLFITKR